MITLPPRLGNFLTQTTQTADLEAALWKVLDEYVDMKIERLAQRVAYFEQKWKMNFEEFSRRTRENSLGQDAFSWEVEQDYWDWESALTLLDHYRTLKV
jgi:hypothetical protein